MIPRVLYRLPAYALSAIIIAATIAFVTVFLFANLILLPFDIAIRALKGSVSP